MAITLKKKNFARSTLASGITDAATSLTVATGDGTKFPQAGKFRAVLFAAAYSNPSDDPNAEIVEAELSAGDAFTITRAQESTTARAWSAGDNFFHVLTAGTIEEIEGNMAFRGALVRRTSAQSIPNGAMTAVNWDAEEYDTDGIHDNATNNSRLTVPSGVSKIRLLGNSDWAVSTVGERVIFMWKNGSAYDIAGYARHASPGYQNANIASPVLNVAAGDYFELIAYQTSGAALNFSVSAAQDRAWFAMEIIE